MVLYFSGTGNSRYVAKKIAEISGDEMISINQRLKDNDYSPVKSDKPLVLVGRFTQADCLASWMNTSVKLLSAEQSRRILSAPVRLLPGRQSATSKKYVNKSSSLYWALTLL